METSSDGSTTFTFLLDNNEHVVLRKATSADAQLIYDLSNEELVRENSINQNKISWEKHVNWLKKKVDDGNCFFLLAFNNNNQFIGQIRIDAAKEDSIIGISITKEFRGKGLSTYLLMNSANLFFQEFDLPKNITAKINKSNEPSLNTFIKAGYVFSHSETINSNEFLVFKLARK